MWHYSDANRFRQPGVSASTGAQSTYDLLVSMHGTAISLLFLDLTEPSKPVSQVPGFLERATTAHVALGLAAPLPALDPRTRFGVEVLSGPGILRFQSTAAKPVEQGATRVELELPRQVESVQRRKFSRAPMSVPVAFAPAHSDSQEQPPPSGIGQGMDLGAGGLRMVTQVPLKWGQYLFVSFNPPDGSVFRGLQSKVVRVQTDGLRCHVGLQFIDLNAQQEAQLVQTVFRLQVRGPVK